MGMDQYLYNTILSGMNIHESQLFGGSPGVLLVLTHCQIGEHLAGCIFDQE